MITQHQYDDAMETVAAFTQAKIAITLLFPTGINGERLLADELLHAHECLDQVMEDAFYRILKDAQMTIELAAKADTRDEDREHSSRSA